MTDNTKKALLISGISIVAVGVGFLGFRIFKRWNKDVVEGKHNTILVDKDESNDDVQVVGYEETTETLQNWKEKPMSEWTEDDYAEYYGAPKLV
jgi:hypothetical protein